MRPMGAHSEAEVRRKREVDSHRGRVVSLLKTGTGRRGARWEVSVT